MEKLINSAFDFFAYALPGAFMILTLLILDKQYDTFQDYLNFAQGLKAGGAAVLLAAGYLTSFATTPFGRLLYKKYQRWLLFRKMDKWLGGSLNKDTYEFDDDRNPELKIPISKKFILVRELTPVNFRYLESWHVYSMMSHNMAVANILVFIFTCIRLALYRPENYWPWVVISIGAVAFAFLFLYNAVKFNVWSMNEQNAAIQAFNLQERAKKLDSQNQSVRI